MSDFNFYMKRFGIKPEECDKCQKLMTLKAVRVNDVVYHYCSECEKKTFESKEE